MQTFLHGPSDRLRRDTVFFVVIHLLGAPIFRNRHQRLHALRHDVGEEHYFSVHMTRRAPRGLNKGSLAAQKSLLVCVQNADERNLGKIEAFTEQINPDKNVEIRGAQSAQDLHALDCVDVAVQVTHFQADIAQVIGKIFRCSLRQRSDQNALTFFHPLAAKLNRLIDLTLQRL